MELKVCACVHAYTHTRLYLIECERRHVLLIYLFLFIYFLVWMQFSQASTFS